ncbi:MAG: ornithine carbamoyltransferase [Gammaproteobacteria bacterium]|nr:ornithine carbamoyltransferase [Gammaproteobacteria bacterium]MCK5498827.1 ornithine carbamoyltransferase [Gammaproteobacteria bacterium]MCK5669335.1 ornithine carbamoyltransferase [Gammaproteobacteria bacterium]
MGLRHFLTLSDVSTKECQTLIERGIEIKSALQKGELYQPLQGKVLAMIFEKSSTRTRVSFEAGMAQFGGHAIFMSPEGTQLGRGEPIEDTARVLSKMVDAIMIRTFEHEKIECLAKYASVPIINGLSDTYHPCQLLADMQTYYEHRGSIEGKTVAWLGDGNNMCHSYMNAARLYGFHLRFACPEGYLPSEKIIHSVSDCVEYFSDARAAVKDADLVVTDVWASMGQEQEADERAGVFAPYQVNAELMALANDDALFMHCLPAHRGEEVTADIIDGNQSVVWDEAGNRLHAQKALLEFLLTK